MGHGYTPAHVKAWQEAVSIEARAAMQGREPLEGPVAVSIDFYLPDHRVKDLDNLSKAVLDACKHIVFGDDTAVYELHLCKFYNRAEIGATVCIAPLPGTP
jgi:Holliday junction resolvase RusA-like endonuclease